jgi:SapC
MTKMLLIYERATPLSSQLHRDLYVKSGIDYRFAAEINAAPLLAPEFDNAASNYVIVFAGEDAIMPVALLGLRNAQNLYIREDGGWAANYIPAFIRQYPFVVSRREGDDNNFTLCIDETWSGCNVEGRGERLFDSDGERTAYLNGIVERVGEYQGQFRRTRRMCATLRELDLLSPMQARVRTALGEELTFSGFYAVDRNRLQNLTGDQLAKLMAEGQLELIYLHLQSLRNLAELTKRDHGPVASTDGNQNAGTMVDGAVQSQAP